MPSRPSDRSRRAARALLAPLAAALLLTACASHEPAAATPDKAARAPATRDAAHDLSYTATSEIRFGGELVGYLVDVQPVPGGIVDDRPWEPGTALIEDSKFEFIGFISPHGTTYRFDADGQPRTVGFGSRSSGIAAFFRRNGEPQLVSLHPGA